MARERRPSAQTMAVLGALADHPDQWHHGYALCRTLGIKAGTVYPILIRLAERGLVETSWEHAPPSGRPPRHQYRITNAGAEYATTHTRAAGRPNFRVTPRFVPGSGGG
jgi:PadR family transcriptional regulator, regulatory protein PadR